MVVDIIFVIEFDKIGEYLVIGDWGGCVVLFERIDGRDVRFIFKSVIFINIVWYISLFLL